MPVGVSKLPRISERLNQVFEEAAVNLLPITTDQLDNNEVSNRLPKRVKLSDSAIGLVMSIGVSVAKCTSCPTSTSNVFLIYQSLSANQPASQSSCQSVLQSASQSTFPVVPPVTVSNALPPGVLLFQFPKSRKYAGTMAGYIRANRREFRIWLNGLLNQPWDTPLHAEDITAVRNWEARYGIRFIPRTGMAEYDPGHEAVRK